MQSSEKKWFEAELEGNPGLRKELELRRKVNKYVDNQDVIAFKQTLMNAEARHRKAAARKKAATKIIIQYAAIFAGLILVGAIGFYILRNDNTSDIASTYTPDYAPLASYRSSSAELDKAYTRATECYNSGNYTEAIKWFNMIVNPDMQVEFLKGSSHMQISQYNEAIGSFSKVVKDNDNLFIEDAKFYLGICYIQTDQENKAKDLLEDIINSENRHKKDAKKLLRKIN